MKSRGDTKPKPSQKTVVLLGLPNVGKSSVFNMISGKYAIVSNYPGTTVSVSETETKFGKLIDAPGIYSVCGHDSDDEECAKKILPKADVVINVLNASTLERDLLLTYQLMKMNLNMILVLNQMDEAEKKGIAVNVAKLSQILGLKAIATVAVKRIGARAIIDALENNEATQPSIAVLSATTEGDMVSNIDELVNAVLIKSPVPRRDHMRSLQDKVLFNPYLAWPIALLILWAMFKILGVYVAGTAVDFLSLFLDMAYVPRIESFVRRMVQNELIRDILLGEFGILTMEIKSIFGVLLPLITGYYAIMSLLEDSGYFPRLTTLTHGFLSKIGLSGKAMIPILLGFGCSSMGILSTRILETKRDRIIAIAIIGIAIPCAAQQTITVALLSYTNNYMVWLIYIAIMLSLIVITGKILNLFLKGRNSDFLIDIPPLRRPSLRHCLKKTFFRSIDFVTEMLFIFTATCLTMTILNRFGMLDLLQRGVSPLVEGMLNLPKDFANVFVIGMIRKDAAAVSLLNVAGIGTKNMLTNAQILTATVVLSLFVPCINAIVMIFKEIGWKGATALWCASCCLSILVGWLLTMALSHWAI